MDKGTVAELKVAAHYAALGCEVYTPVGGKTSCDLIIIRDGTMHRVEVKCTATVAAGCSSWAVSLRQIRPNRTGNTVKKFNANQCDLLAVYILPEDRIVEFDASTLDGRSSLNIKWIGGRVDEGSSLEN